MMPAFAADPCLHTDGPALAGEADRTPRRIPAWIAGASLIALGLSGLSGDRLLWLFDSACVAVGLLALPPITDAVRERLALAIGRKGHIAFGVALLAGALFLNMSDLMQGPASYPVQSHAHQISFGTVNLRAADDSASAEAEKQAYLSKVRGQLAAAEREAALIADTDATPTAYDEEMLYARASLVSRRSSMSLSHDEAALVGKLAARVAETRAAIAPGLRRAYVDRLEGPLSGYGVRAALVGDSVIEFSGAALAEPKRREALLALTAKERGRLGFTDVRFATGGRGADVNAPSAAVHTTSAAVGETAEGPPA